MHRFVTALTCLLLPAILVADELYLQSEQLPALPVPVANNAVTSLSVGANEYLISFTGIATKLEHSDTHARTFVYESESGKWREADPVPGDVGRLAATATAVKDRAYVFGGYSVAADGSEVSTPWTHAFDPVSGVFEERGAMPVPVDDAVSVAYLDRYIYLISGWHDFGNVNLVQMYDTLTDEWSQATPLPGASLFGHSGGIVDNQIVYCDGVVVQAHADRRRDFVASSECWLGIIAADNIRRIDWRPVPPHPGKPRYRMAAAGIADAKGVLFLGGSENPYNYNGIGYDGQPSDPAPGGLFWNLATMTWQVVKQDIMPSMDHRGLVPFGDRWVTIGGMTKNQIVSDRVTALTLRGAPQ